VSYFDDYIADGLCCESCGGMIDSDEPGFVRLCAGCQPRPAPAPKSKRKLKSKRRAHPTGSIKGGDRG
jgi:hypothetical protein